MTYIMNFFYCWKVNNKLASSFSNTVYFVPGRKIHLSSNNSTDKPQHIQSKFSTVMVFF